MMVTHSYTGSEPVTPSDVAAQYVKPAAGFIVGSAGTVSGIAANGQPFGPIPFGMAGQGIDLAFTWIKATGTTCTGIQAFTDEGFPGTK